MLSSDGTNDPYFDDDDDDDDESNASHDELEQRDDTRIARNAVLSTRTSGT